MAQTIKLKRSNTADALPTTAQLASGELAMNTRDGKVYMRKYIDGTNGNDQIVQISGSGSSSVTTGTSDPSSDLTEGDLFYDTDDDIFKIYTSSAWKALGFPTSEGIEFYEYDGSDGATYSGEANRSFSGNDNSNNSLKYIAGFLEVYLNGVRLQETVDFVATDGATVILEESAENNDILQITRYSKFLGNGDNTVDTFTVASSATQFTLSVAPASEANTAIYVDGVYQNKTSYTLSGTTLDFGSGNSPGNGAIVEAIIFSSQISAENPLSELNVTGTSTLSGAVTANAGVIVDNITIDGQEIDVSSGNLTLDVAGYLDIDVDDGGSVYFSDGGVTFGRIYGTGTHLIIKSQIGDKSIKFEGVDGSSAITALTLDMSDAGHASFNNHITATGNIYTAGNVNLTVDNKKIRLGAGEDLQLYHDGSNSYINDTGTGALFLKTSYLAVAGANGNQLINAEQGAAVELYHNNSKKVETTSNGIKVTDRVTGSSNLILNTIDSNEKIHLDASGYIKLETAGTERMRIDSSGNVGIGTTSPNYTLDVAGDIGVNEYIYHNDDTNTYIRFTPDNFLVRVNGDDRLIINSTGNVGIGVTPNAGWVASSDFRALQVGTGIALWGRGSGDEDRGGLTANLYHNGSAYKYIAAGHATSYQQNDGNHRFSTAVSGSADATATLVESLTILADGKVGVGVSSPGYKLVVNDTTAADNRTIAVFEGQGNAGSQAAGGQYIAIQRTGPISNASANVVGGILMGQNNLVTQANCGIRGTYEYNNGRDVEIFTSSDNTSAPTTKLWVMGSGKVGIGVPGPTAFLDVRENSDASTKMHLLNPGQTTAGRETEFIFGKDNGANLAGNLKYYYHTTQANRRIDLHHYTTGKGLSILNDGTIGIGAASTAPAGLGGGIHFEHASDPRILIERTTAVADTSSILGRIEFGNRSVDDSLVEIRATQDGATDAGQLHFSTEATGGVLTYRMTIDSDGNVGIGTSAPATKLHVVGNTAVGTASGNATIDDNFTTGGLDVAVGSGTKAFQIWDDNVTGTPRFSVLRNGNTYINSAAATPSATQSGFLFTTDQLYCSAGATANANYQIRFYNTNGLIGSIMTQNSVTAYNTSSDYRLKENVITDWDATTRLKQLKPSRFNFITSADSTMDGFLAHEVANIVPEAITGEKDGVDSDGNPEYQQIDQSKLVPLLVKTIQELEARIAALEA